MERTQVKYDIVDKTSPKSLVTAVNKMIEKGYQAHGSLQVIMMHGVVHAIQPMVKYFQPDNSDD